MPPDIRTAPHHGLAGQGRSLARGGDGNRTRDGGFAVPVGPFRAVSPCAATSGKCCSHLQKHSRALTIRRRQCRPVATMRGGRSVADAITEGLDIFGWRRLNAVTPRNLLALALRDGRVEFLELLGLADTGLNDHVYEPE
jgi:hypothetical protein